MKGNSNLRFVVNSKKSLIGTAQFLPDDLFKPKPDEKGMIRVSSATYDIFCQ